MSHGTAAALIRQERARQISGEGWTPEHDDEHADGQMLRAAVIYLHWGTDRAAPMTGDRPMGWPWGAEWWKPKSRERNLERAGALCIAETERLIRADKPYSHVLQKYELILTALDAAL
jgi:hypothetical protein